MAYCPNCGDELAINALNCLTCEAVFGENSAWQPLVKAPPGRDSKSIAEWRAVTEQRRQARERAARTRSELSSSVEAKRSSPLIAKVVFFAYLVVVIIALITALADPVWSGRGRGGEIHGLLGFFALFVAALPWSLIFLFINRTGRLPPTMTADLIVSGANLGFIVLNVCILGWLAFRRVRTSKMLAPAETDDNSNDK